MTKDFMEGRLKNTINGSPAQNGGVISIEKDLDMMAMEERRVLKMRR